MAKYGRKIANIISIIIVLAGWIGISTANNMTWLLMARILQGLSLGMTSCVVPTVIGEYTSPKNRGAFSMSMSLVMALGTLVTHTLGSYLYWKTTALVCGCITFVDLIMVASSPESPSWLADQGRYDECKRVFKWLRGDEELDELNRMVAANQLDKETKEDRRTEGTKSFKEKLAYIRITIKKIEFYKPILIMIHLFTLGQWGGINVLAPYAMDVITNIVGPETNAPPVVIAIGVTRIISSIIAVYIIRRIKRRTMLFSTVGMNTIIIFITAGYVYAKTHNVFTSDHPLIGIALILIHMFTVAAGSLPLPYTIAGEIFPLEYRSLSSGISSVFCSLNIFISVKTLPYLFKTVGVHGAYILYGCILVHCLIVAWFYLPETKDKTLQEIEDELRKKNVRPEDVNAAQPLTEWKSDGNRVEKEQATRGK